ncbi:MAG TPA: SGNH/GDSL hydrolase family protein [Tepidisphaeraceae bacterium]|nr:SGNH/GDSL hydrolase family protein [Tepidisphaeraceae bacterium]
MTRFPSDMKQWLLLAVFCTATLVRPLIAAAAASPKLDLNDGDRVAFLGNTFVEREQKADYIEAMLISHFPGKNIAFRNLGYSADTATGEARGLCAGWTQFEAPDKAFERLRKLVAEFKPTVLLINYGMTESFFGPEKLPEFVANYNKMLDALSAAAGGSPRLVLMSPNYHEDLGKPLPDPSAHNKNLRIYSDAIGKIAAQRGALFIDLMALTERAGKSPDEPFLTWNGIHLTPYGYWRVALDIERSLGLSPRYWHIKVEAGGAVDDAAGTKLSDVKVQGDALRFSATDDLLAVTAMPKDPLNLTGGFAVESPLPLPAEAKRTVIVNGLKPGTYELKAGNEILASGTHDAWARGIDVKAGPAGRQAEELRAALIAKDFDYFNYQRPDNDSYIFAFRKREQGRNAVEIPQFLPLVEEKEKQIASLRVPASIAYVLQRAAVAK